MFSKLVVTVLVSAFGLPLALGDAAPNSKMAPGRIPNTVHVVHLRTGTIDVDVAQKRLPPPTPTARRRLLQQQQQWTPSASTTATTAASSAAAAAGPPTPSPEWGPLADCQLWLLTLGPSLHWHPNQHRDRDRDQDQDQDWEQGGGRGENQDWEPEQGDTQLPLSPAQPIGSATASASAAAAALKGQWQHHRISNRDAAVSQEQQQFGGAQALLRARLHGAGVALVAFLPPAAWLLAVAGEADLAPLLADFPDVRLGPYGPPSLRVSPELAAVVELLRAEEQQEAGGGEREEGGGEGASVAGGMAARLAAGERLDKLLQEARREQSDWLLGAMRQHPPTHGSKTGSAPKPPGSPPTDPQRRRARVRVQIEVHFPHLDPEDLGVLRAAAAVPPVRQMYGADGGLRDTSDVDDDDNGDDGGEGEGGPGGNGGSRQRAGPTERAPQRRRLRREAGGGGGGAGGTSYHPASAAAADWLAPLVALSPPDCPPLMEADFGSPVLLLVGVCPEALPAVVEWLAGAPQVSWLSPRMTSRLHNLVAGAIVQTGGAARFNASSPSAHPFWAAGLDGNNQIVGCGDSGLDYGNCFFYDSKVDVSRTQLDSKGMPLFLSDGHRKLRSYAALVQDMVDNFGHGTHVAGTLVGSRYDRTSYMEDPLQAGTGQAPAAKIAFLDLSRGNSDRVWTPGDLYGAYFNVSYRVGARVHSDSWGSELTAYDSMSASLDRFTFVNQDFVSVFAAGNYGDKSPGSSRGTVTSPAVAKNCIAVGATLAGSPLSGGFSRTSGVPMSNMTVTLELPGQTRFTRSVRVVKAGFGAELDTAGAAGGAGGGGSAVSGQMGLVVASPDNACTGLTNAGAVSGRAILVQRGGCYFTDKARNAAAAGARAVIVYNDVKDSGYFLMNPPSGYSGGHGNVALGSVPMSTGTWLKASVEAGTVTVSFSRVDTSTDYPAFEDIAPYSSVGPTTDGRIKPDIVAPGTLISANSSRVSPLPGSPGSCNPGISLMTMSGTSMATPVVAGSALLVRQYFTDGYYPEGVRNAANGFTPSGPLIKAVMLGGAQHMAGVVSDTGMPLEEGPSYRQGFGRLSLAHSLPLSPSATPTNNPNNPGWRMQVVDGAALSSDQQHQYCVTALGGPLRITLAWYDFPAEQAAARALVNNLDLLVRAAGRGLLADYGNGAPDSVNTVEQVRYDNLPPGDVAITVIAKSIFQKATQQPYALVVQGNFSGRLPGRTGPDPTKSGSGVSMCAAQLASIDDEMSSSPVTNNRDLIFFIRTQDGSIPSSGFQCRLQPASNTTTTTTTSDWQPCSLPYVRYPNQADGKYNFQVRVSGESVATSRSVLVDTVPPVISLNSTLPPNAASAAEGGGIAWDNATFTFSATDATSTVNFTCRVDFTGGPKGTAEPPFLRFGPGTAAAAPAGGGGSGGANGSMPAAVGGEPVTVKRTFACGSPVELIGMTYGDYSLLVSAIDDAGNRADAPTVAWKVRYNPSTSYTRLTRGLVGLVPTRELQYGVVGFQGNAAATTPPQDLGLNGGQNEYEFTAVQLPGSTGGGGVGGGGSGIVAGSSVALPEVAAGARWSALTSEVEVKANVSSDGRYLVLARRRNNIDAITWGVAAVQVDTTPPIVVITLAPKPLQSDPRVTIKFADNSTGDDVRAFLCRWLSTPGPEPPSANTPEDEVNYLPCSRDGTAFNVSEGYWLFQVKGKDAAGNIGPPASVSFVTDLQPPAISTTLPTVVNTSRLEWSYMLEDTGTGVNDSSCVFRWVALDNATVVVDGDADFPSASQRPEWSSPCPQGPFRYTLQEGLYMWSIAATDRAGLRASLDRELVADFTRPTSKATTGNRRRLPAKFTVYVTSRDLPKTINSGLLQQECRLDAAAAPPPASPPLPPPASPPPASQPPPPPGASLPPNSRVAAARPALAPSSPSPTSPTTSTTGNSGRRMAQQTGTGSGGDGGGGGGGGPRLSNGSAIQLGRWHVCDPSGAAVNITYDGFSSGFYTFSVRALDRAGNLGLATEPLFFEVDDSLPTEGDTRREVGASSGGGSDRTKKIIIGVAIGVGVVALSVAAIAIYAARRRHLRKRYGDSPPPPPPLPPLRTNGAGGGGGIALQPMAYVNGNGNGNGYGMNGHAAPPSASVVVGTPSVAAAAVTSGGVVMATPADTALAAALAASAVEAQRAQSAAVAAAAAMEEEERLRRAIAASIEEENLRRAREASLAAAHHATAEQSALEAAIAASLATANQERQRQELRNQQHRLAAAAQQQHQQLPPSAPPPPPSPPPPPPPSSSRAAPDYGLL